MTLSFKFNKHVKNFLLFGLIILTLNIVLEIILSGDIIKIFSKKPMAIFFMILWAIGFYRMCTRDFLIIENNKIYINSTFFPKKQVIFFEDIKEASFIKSKIKIISSHLVLFLKSGKRHDVNFMNLSKDDRQKVIEVFKDKGLL